MMDDARFKMLFFETGLGISLVDMDRRIIEVNPAFEKMTGYTNAEVKGQTFAKLMYPEDNARNLALHQEMLAGTRRLYHMERRYIRKDGVVLWTRLTVSLFRDAEGKPQFTMGTMEDITETKVAQQKMRDQDQLLVQASKMSALGEMAGGIAHEIQTPLTIIRFRAEALKKMAQEKQLDESAIPKIIENTEQIEKTVMRISSIVKGLRAFARKGEQDPCQKTSLKPLIEETLELCRDKFKYSSVELIVSAIPEGLSVECRPTQIQQVLVNLLGNAFDAVQALETKWVRLEVAPAADSSDSIVISVTDSGPGIPPAVVEKLFVQGGGFTTKPVGKGTGLGLSISRSIVESHHGSLWVDAGCANTRFVIVLPQHQPEASAVAA